MKALLSRFFRRSEQVHRRREDDEEHGQKTFFIKFSYALSLRYCNLDAPFNYGFNFTIFVHTNAFADDIDCEKWRRTKDNPITRRMHCVLQLRSPARRISKVKNFIQLFTKGGSAELKTRGSINLQYIPPAVACFNHIPVASCNANPNGITKYKFLVR